MIVKNDSVFLRHILDAIKRVEKYLSDVSESAFDQDSLLQDGIIRQIEIIGEATKNISTMTRNKYRKVPWKDMAGMRDKLIHGYFGVDINAVWETAQKDIPVLKILIKKILKDYPID
jgi:uncharacterized protein with HEPN domain